MHIDWTAWDAWMEANDALVQRGVVPSPEEITRRHDLTPDPPTERDVIIAEHNKFQRDAALLEESRMAAIERIR